jgi:hypothetical protein
VGEAISITKGAVKMIEVFCFAENSTLNVLFKYKFVPPLQPHNVHFRLLKGGEL